MDRGQPGSSVHGIFQASILEWVAIFSSRGSSLTQGSNLRLLLLLHWQTDSVVTLSHMGIPVSLYAQEKIQTSFFFFYSSVFLFKNKNRICLRCTWWFDVPIHSEMITTVKLINISISSHSYFFFFLMKVPEIYSLSRFWEYNTVLFTTVRVFTSPLDLTHPAELQFCVLWPTFPRSPISLPVVTTILFSASIYVTCVNKSLKYFSFCVWFISLSLMPSSFIPFVANGRVFLEGSSWSEP